MILSAYARYRAKCCFTYVISFNCPSNAKSDILPVFILRMRLSEVQFYAQRGTAPGSNVPFLASVLLSSASLTPTDSTVQNDLLGAPASEPPRWQPCPRVLLEDYSPPPLRTTCPHHLPAEARTSALLHSPGSEQTLPNAPLLPLTQSWHFTSISCISIA